MIFTKISKHNQWMTNARAAGGMRQIKTGLHSLPAHMRSNQHATLTRPGRAKERLANAPLSARFTFVPARSARGLSALQNTLILN